MTGVNAGELTAAALLLSLERVAYVVICRRPDWFQRVCAAWLPQRLGPVDALTALFVAFKVIQFLIFAWWWMRDGHGLRPVSMDAGHLVLGGVLLVLGQILNVSVFARLGRVGVFYGGRLGHPMEWHRGFPFSWFRHPQYVGTVMSIWAGFLIMRYPADDWLVLPLLETVYYVVGAWLEQRSAGTLPQPG